MVVESKVLSFNPRPPRKGGATDVDGALRDVAMVSILAPLARGALREVEYTIPVE